MFEIIPCGQTNTITVWAKIGEHCFAWRFRPDQLDDALWRVVNAADPTLLAEDQSGLSWYAAGVLTRGMRHAALEMQGV